MSLFIVGSVLIKHILSRTKWDTVLCGMNQLLVMTMRTWHSIDCGEMVTVSDSSWGHQLVPCGCYCEEWVGQLWSKWNTEELIMTILCLLRNTRTVLSRHSQVSTEHSFWSDYFDKGENLMKVVRFPYIFIQLHHFDICLVIPAQFLRESHRHYTSTAHVLQRVFPESKHHLNVPTT